MKNIDLNKRSSKHSLNNDFDVSFGEARIDQKKIDDALQKRVSITAVKDQKA